MLQATVLSAIDFRLIAKAERDLHISGMWYFIIFGTPDECMAAAYVREKQAKAAKQANDFKTYIEKMTDVQRLERLARDPNGPPPRPSVKICLADIGLEPAPKKKPDLAVFFRGNVVPMLAHPDDRVWPLTLLERVEELLEEWDFSYFFEQGTYEECLAAAALCRYHASLDLTMRASMLSFAGHLEKHACEADAGEAILW